MSDYRASARESAPDPAAASFFNALLRETSGWRLETGSGGRVAVLPVDDGELHLPIAHRSASGECRFRWPIVWARGERRTPLKFAAALDRVLATTSLVGPLSHEQHEDFRRSVLESHRNVANSLAGRTDLAHLQTGALTFAEAEQGLLLGHPFHPAPKARSPFTDAEALRFCPEHGARFGLVWWAVAPDILAGDSSRGDDAAALMDGLLPDDLRVRLPDGFAALAMHPWQAHTVRKSEAVCDLERRGLLRRLGEGAPEWLPTSSHRSLYAPGVAWMLKGSLSARLTNSLRLLSTKEVERGLNLDRWTRALDLARRFPGFGLMQEPAWLGWRDLDGSVAAESLMVLRENPLREQPDAEVVVLATLTQQPFTRTSGTPLASLVRTAARAAGRPLHATAREWFAAFCERVLTPLVGLVVEEGIVLLAHQQNILLRLDRGWPVGMYYRDCQGSGVSDRFLERQGHSGEPPENHWPQATVRRYFLYYLLVNTTFAVTGALAADGLVDEGVLIDDLRAHLEGLRTRLDGDLDCLEHALTAERLEAKGNFFCYLSGVNEATLAQPARLYRPIPNPLTCRQSHAAPLAQTPGDMA